MALRIFAIGLIFVCTSIAWMVLGQAISKRATDADYTISREVGQLWGTAHRQSAPRLLSIDTSSVPMNLSSSEIAVDLELEHRRRGLHWYSLYIVQFDSAFTLANTSEQVQDFHFEFSLPDPDGDYDNIHLKLDDIEVENYQTSNGAITLPIHLEPGQSRQVTLAYQSRGADQWFYDFGSNQGRVKNFKLTMTTNFKDIDFPEDASSPKTKNETTKGMKLTWQYDNKLSGLQVGMVMPEKLNPGPWVERVTYWAPVSLALFFFLLFITTTLKKINIHPMNYFFVAGAFFAYHLLLTYLVDHIDINLAFWISSAVSIFLVVSYMRLVVGNSFAFFAVGLSQFVYLVLFSYAFFFEGFTGLSITILCIVTLFIVMQATGKLNWDELFKANPLTKSNDYGVMKPNGHKPSVQHPFDKTTGYGPQPNLTNPTPKPPTIPDDK